MLLTHDLAAKYLARILQATRSVAAELFSTDGLVALKALKPPALDHVTFSEHELWRHRGSLRSPQRSRPGSAVEARPTQS